MQELVQQPLEGLPPLEELSKVLFQLPVAKLPVDSDALSGLQGDTQLTGLCELDDGSHRRLALRLTDAMTAFSFSGAEPLTSHLVNKFLLDLLLGGLEMLLPYDQQLGLTVRRDEGDDDSTMMRASATGRSLRPDSQLRSSDGLRLLFKWEEKAAGVAFRLALGDLKGKDLQP